MASYAGSTDRLYLSGEIEAEVSDGDVRRFGPGSITLVEDLSGKGHASRVVGVRFAVADEHTGQVLNAARRNGMLETPGCPAPVRTWLQDMTGPLLASSPRRIRANWR